MTPSTLRRDFNDLVPKFSAPFSSRGLFDLPIENSRRRSRQSASSVFDVARAGETAVKLSTNLVQALSSLNVSAKGFGGTDISDGIAEFKITGGAADLNTTKVEIIHRGGLSFKGGQTTVDLTDFIITNLGDRTVLTGLVTVNNDLVTRAPLFDLKIGGVSSDRKRATLDFSNVAVTLTSEAASTLNQVFRVSAFTAGLNVGTAEVDAFLNQPFRSPGSSSKKGSRAINRTPIRGLARNTVFDVGSSGETDVQLSRALVSALDSFKVEALGFGGTTIRGGSAGFKITGGAVDLDTTKVELIHTGGLSLKAGKTTVDLSDFIISNLDGRTSLTGLVTVNGNLVARASLFDLKVGDVAALGKTNHPVLDLSNVQVSLSSAAAKTLNQAFGVSAFNAGFNVGTAEAETVLRRPSRR